MTIRIKEREQDIWMRMEGQYWSLVETKERATPFASFAQAKFVFRGMPDDIKANFALVEEDY